MTKPGEYTENYLLEQGFAGAPSEVRRAKLACIVCQVATKLFEDAEPTFEGWRVALCADVGKTAIDSFGGRLEQAGLVVPVFEHAVTNRNAPRHKREAYRPVVYAVSPTQYGLRDVILADAAAHPGCMMVARAEAPEGELL